MKKRVLVTGGTGFIGRALVAALRDRGDDVAVITRSADRARDAFGDDVAAPDGGAVTVIAGDVTEPGPWQQAVGGVDAVIHLAGQPIADKRWNARYKQRVHDSRVEGTRFVVEAIAAVDADRRPAALLSSSGIDYYPFAVDLGAALDVDEDDEVAEGAPPGSSFLARVCRNWEAEAREAEALGVRVAYMRTGVVLGGGGPLDRMKTPFRLLVGGRIGSGRQWFSWIHADDAVRAYLHVLDGDDARGPFNLVAPTPVRAGEFARALGRAMNRPAWLPVPAFALKLAVGEFAEYLLHGRRAVPRALLARGFEFAYPAIGEALAEIL